MRNRRLFRWAGSLPMIPVDGGRTMIHPHTNPGRAGFLQEHLLRQVGMAMVHQHIQQVRAR